MDDADAASCCAICGLVPLCRYVTAIRFAICVAVIVLAAYVVWLHRRAQRQQLGDVRPQGLDRKVLRSIAVLVRGSNASPAECAVCLNDLKVGEEVRVLPPCRHEFHVRCIDVWFERNSTCPLCRAVVTPESKAAATGSLQALEPEPPGRVSPVALLKAVSVGDQRAQRTADEQDLERGECSQR